MFSFSPAVTTDELATMLDHDRPTHVVDLRDPTQHRAGHIHDSTSLPFSRIDRDNVGAELGTRAGCSEPLCLVSNSGRMAERAALRLRHQGLDRVYILDGGIQAWRADRRPLTYPNRRFTLQQQLNLIAGVLLLVLLAKALLLHPVFYVLTGVVGVALITAAFGDRRDLKRLLQSLPWNRRAVVGRPTSG